MTRVVSGMTNGAQGYEPSDELVEKIASALRKMDPTKFNNRKVYDDQAVSILKAAVDSGELVPREWLEEKGVPLDELQHGRMEVAYLMDNYRTVTKRGETYPDWDNAKGYRIRPHEVKTPAGSEENNDGTS